MSDSYGYCLGNIEVWDLKSSTENFFYDDYVELKAERDDLHAKLEAFKSMLDIAWDGLQEADYKEFSLELKKFMEEL